MVNITPPEQLEEQNRRARGEIGTTHIHDCLCLKESLVSTFLDVVLENHQRRVNNADRNEIIVHQIRLRCS